MIHHYRRTSGGIVRGTSRFPREKSLLCIAPLICGIQLVKEINQLVEQPADALFTRFIILKAEEGA